MNNKSSTTIKSVDLTLDILEAISHVQDGIGVSDLADKLGSTKATIFRHLRTLLARGYLSQDRSNSKYKLGVRVHLLGKSATNKVDLVTQSKQIINDLRDITGESVTLSAVGTRSVIVLDTIFGTSVFEIGVRPGTEMNFHSSAQGKVALAFSKQPLLNLIKNSHLEKLTEFTVTDYAELEKEINLVRKQGWSIAPQEMILGLNAIAAPIFDESGDCVGTLGLVGLIQFVGMDPNPKHLFELKKAAHHISLNLGYRNK